MADKNEDVRIKMEPVVGNDEETQHLYDNDSTEEEDVKPAIIPTAKPSVSGYIELSSDDDIPARQARKKRKRSSFYIRLVLKEVATQTDGDVEKKDAGINTDPVPKAELGVNTDDPPTTAEIGVLTEVITDVPNNEEEKDEDADEDDEQHPTPSSSKDIYHQCTLCSCYYLSFNLLQKHSRAQHNKTIAEQRKVSYVSNCKFCSASYVFATYNKHIKNKHKDKFTMNDVIKRRKLVGPFECSLCHARFLSYNEGKRHRRVHEHIEKKFVLRKLKTVGETTPVAGLKEEKRKLQMTPSNRALITKNMLFQCPKCELNFFTYRSGLRHRVACERGAKRGIEAQCTKCEKKFLQVHIRNHNLQHERTDDFIIQKVVDGIEHRIMYHCLKCKVCMDERGCRLHLQCGCESTVGVTCSVCQLKVDESFATSHKGAHEHMGLVKEDVILVDTL